MDDFQSTINSICLREARDMKTMSFKVKYAAQFEVSRVN